MSTFATPAATVERDGWKRPLIYPTPDAKKPVAYTRCTTFVSALEDTYNLNRWSQRAVALGLSERPDLVLSVANARDDKDALNKVCKDAHEAAKSGTGEVAESARAAEVGTQLHKLAERLDRGEDIGTVPEPYRSDLAAYHEKTAGWTYAAIERFMVLDAWRIGGTPDRIVELDGKRRIADLKTGSIRWGMGKIAQQLAVYSRSMLYDPQTRERIPADVETDWGIVVHLPAGEAECTLYRVDLDVGWNGVRLSKWVREWRSRPFRDYAEPMVATSPVAELIDTAETVDALTRIWVNYEPVWTDDLTKRAAARKALLQGRVA